MRIGRPARARVSLVGMIAIAAAGMTFAACSSGSMTVRPQRTAADTPSAAVPTVDVSGIPSDVGRSDSAQFTGAGSTLAAPLYTRWFFDYQHDVAPGVRGNYQAIGSGGGIQNIIRKTIDFGATDAPMTDAQIAKAPGIQAIPTALGAIVITHNIDGVTQALKLDGPTLAKIYLGKITRWDDPAITAQNHGVHLPDAQIIVVHRSDGSGTSYAFTDYLSAISSDWRAQVGTSKNPQWPLGLGGQGNDGVTQQVKQNRNSIGYVDLIFADKNHLPLVQMKNADGAYITPTIAATSAAAKDIQLPPDYRVSIVNSKTPGAYPIATFTWILLYRDQTDASKGKALVDFLWWAVHDGQKSARELDYAPLPDDVVGAVEQTLATQITHNGQPLLAMGGER